MNTRKRLQKRLEKRRARRDRQLALWKKTGKVGHRRSARRNQLAVNKLRKLIDDLKPLSGTGDWEGTESIVDNEVAPVAKRFGIPETSRKRSASDPNSIANPDSDHNEANEDAYAIDFGTNSGRDLAYAIADELGIDGFQTGSYTSYYITRAGKKFRVQILWAVAGHYDHVHVGVRAE